MYKSRFIIQAHNMYNWLDDVVIPSKYSFEILMKTKLSIELESDDYEQV